jgi:hypothetical protein
MENKIHSKNNNLISIFLISLASFLLFFVFLSEKNEIAAVSSTNITTPQVSTNTNQNLNNLNEQQLVELIASTVSIANNIDKNKVLQVVNDLSASKKATGSGNVIDSLKNIAGFVLNDPSGNVAKNIIKVALKNQTTLPPPPQATTPPPPQATTPPPPPQATTPPPPPLQATTPPPQPTTTLPPQPTTSLSCQELMKIDIAELKENLVITKESLVEGDTEAALTGVADTENLLLPLENPITLQNYPFTVEIQNIKDYISMAKLKEAIDEVSKIQIAIIKAEGEICAAQLENPDLVESQQDKEDKDDDNGDKDDDNGDKDDDNGGDGDDDNGGDGDGGNGGDGDGGNGGDGDGGNGGDEGNN